LDGGEYPGEAKAQESYALCFSLNRWFEVADSRMEQNPEGGAAPRVFTFGWLVGFGAGLAHATDWQVGCGDRWVQSNAMRVRTPETVCGCARGAML
jgi:hypothetical protein